jgi:hypothetical protein
VVVANLFVFITPMPERKLAAEAHAPAE